MVVEKSGGKILADHKRKKRLLVPPLLSVMGDKYSPYSWAQQLVPELLWISLLLEHLGLRRGVEVANQLGQLASEFCSQEPKPMFVKITSFAKLGDDEKVKVQRSLGELVLRDLNRGLQPLHNMLPENALAFLRVDFVADTESLDENNLTSLLEQLYDRHSRMSAVTMATAIYLGLRQDKIRLTENVYDKVMQDFRVIDEYPNTEESEMAAASFRAAAPAFLMSGEGGISSGDDDWLQSFWEAVKGVGDCVQPIDIQLEEVDGEDALFNIIVSFKNAAKIELKERLSCWGYDLKSIEVYEVIGALLARQVTLAIDLANSPALWTPNSAPIMLRAMADVYVTMAWILKDAQDRSKRFIDDSLGAIKLELAHRKENLKTLDDPEEIARLESIVEYWEKWVSSQRMEDFVVVNLGSWSGLTTRKMAEEADCLDFYNFVYQPFSSAVHSNWAHVSDKNTVYCGNPAHRYHRIPTIMEFEPDVYWLHLAAKYLDKTFSTFDRESGVNVDVETAFSVLMSKLTQSEQSDTEI